MALMADGVHCPDRAPARTALISGIRSWRQEHA
jgi:hypothetical protein